MFRVHANPRRAVGVALLATTILFLTPLLAAAQRPDPPVLLEPGELPPPPPPSSQLFPMSWNDPMFADVATSSAVNLRNGAVRSNLSITDSGNIASVVGGSFTLNTSRISSREAIRADGGDIQINWVWAEAKGIGDDHADVLQCYGPGSRGDITVRNTTFRAYNQAATAGYFAADNWNGIHRFENVLFWGGPFGLRLNSDGGDGVYMKNVYFVGPFMWAPFQIQVPILQWENVYHATIQNGQLVVGDPIPRPR